MNDVAMIGASTAGGVTLGGVIAFLVLSRKLKEYIQDAMGTKPNVAATVTPAVRYATHEELEKVWAETRQLRAQVSEIRSEFSKTTEKIIGAGDARESRIVASFHTIALDLANKVGEARGQLSRIP